MNNDSVRSHNNRQTSNGVKPLFPGQQPQEKICLITRPHWVVLARRLLLWLLFVALLFVADSLVAAQFPFLLTSPYVFIFNLAKTLYLMFLVAGAFSLWILYYLNYQIVTSERIVDITQDNLLSHSLVEFNLARVQDVTAEMKGIWGNLFNFGNVFVETAGEHARFEFNDIPDPHRVAKLILDLYEELPAERRAEKE